MPLRLLLALCLCLLGLAVTACAPKQAIEAMGKMAKIAMDPDMPIGAPKDQPSVAVTTIYVEPGTNKNDFGEPTPVDVWVFQLSDKDKLLSTDFLTLTADPKTTLGTSYVAHKEKQVAPGESSILPAWEHNKETTLIGIAVGYANIDTINWRAVERVNATGEAYNIHVPVQARTVAIQVHR